MFPLVEETLTALIRAKVNTDSHTLEWHLSSRDGKLVINLTYNPVTTQKKIIADQRPAVWNYQQPAARQPSLISRRKRNAARNHRRERQRGAMERKMNEEKKHKKEEKKTETTEPDSDGVVQNVEAQPHVEQTPPVAAPAVQKQSLPGPHHRPKAASTPANSEHSYIEIDSDPESVLGPDRSLPGPHHHPEDTTINVERSLPGPRHCPEDMLGKDKRSLPGRSSPEISPLTATAVSPPVRPIVKRQKTSPETPPEKPVTAPPAKPDPVPIPPAPTQEPEKGKKKKNKKAKQKKEQHETEKEPLTEGNFRLPKFNIYKKFYNVDSSIMFLMTTDLDGRIEHHSVIVQRNKKQCSLENANFSNFDLSSLRVVTKQKVDRDHWTIYQPWIVSEGKHTSSDYIELLTELAEHAYRFKM